MEHYFGITNSGYLIYLGKFKADTGEGVRNRFEGQITELIYEETARDFQAVLNSVLKETA